MYICKLDEKEFETSTGLWWYIKREFGMTTKEYYDKFLKNPGDGICLCCGKNTYFEKSKYRKFCDIKCSSGFNRRSLIGREVSGETREKLSSANRKRDPSWKEKRRKTVEERYGMTYEEHKRILWEKRFSVMTPEQIKEHYDKTVLAQGSGRARYKFKEYILNGKPVNLQG